MHAFLPKYESRHLMSVRNRIDHLFARLAVFFATVLAFAIATTSQPKTAIGEESPLPAHCGDCHTGNDAEGDFSLGQIGSDADKRDYEVDYTRIRLSGFETSVDIDTGLNELIGGLALLRLKNPHSNV